MDIARELKSYKTFHLPEPMVYPVWLFDSNHDFAEKHPFLSKFFKKRKFGDTSKVLWVDYSFSPRVYSIFENEIVNSIEGNNAAFARFLKIGLFDSDPYFKLHIFRGVRLYKDDSDILVGMAGLMTYFIMSDVEADNFSIKDLKVGLGLDDVIRINYD